VKELATPGCSWRRRGGASHTGAWRSLGRCGCRGGSSVEEPPTPSCSWTGAVGGGGRVPALDDGAAAAAIDLSKWAWTRGRARVKSPNFRRLSQ
jgi:hypothetical protein